MTSTKTVRQFKDVIECDPDAPTTDADRAEAAAYLREQFRIDGMSLAADPEPSAPEPVTLNAARDGWFPYDGKAALDGYVITWTGTGAEAVTDPDAPLAGSWNEERTTYTVPLPAVVTAAGGAVRIVHGHGGPVTVHAWRSETEGIGYLFAQDLTDDEVHVELMPGAVRVTVTPDEVEA